MICKECGGEMYPGDVPDEIFIIKVPFTKYELRLWKWTVQYDCLDCESERQAEQESRRYHAAYDDGYSAAYEARDTF